jgi:hypothetical protein
MSLVGAQPHAGSIWFTSHSYALTWNTSNASLPEDYGSGTTLTIQLWQSHRHSQVSDMALSTLCTNYPFSNASFAWSVPETVQVSLPWDERALGWVGAHVPGQVFNNSIGNITLTPPLPASLPSSSASSSHSATVALGVQSTVADNLLYYFVLYPSYWDWPVLRGGCPSCPRSKGPLFSIVNPRGLFPMTREF